MPSTNYACSTSYDAKNKIWSGIKVDVPYGPASSLGEVMLKALLKDPEHIYQICHHNGKKYTNSEIANLSKRVAQHFRKLKIPQCEIIGLIAGNSDYLTPLFIGAMLAGLIVCALEPAHNEDILKQAFGTTKPSIIFTDGNVYQKVKRCQDELNFNAIIYTMNDHMRGVPEFNEFLHATGFAKDFKPEPLKFDYLQTAVILRSSGSTGTPKMICISHASLLNAYHMPLESNDIMLRIVKICWISGLIRLISCCLQNVTTVINATGVPATMIKAMLKNYKITVVNTAPRFLAELVRLPDLDKTDFSSLREYQIGGSGMPYTLVEKAKIYMPTTKFLFIYGSTEAGGISNGPCNPSNNVGQLVTNLEVKIIDDDDNNLGIGQTGEICTKNIIPWNGYHNNPAATAVTYQNGWIHSGDLGYVDTNGNLVVVERKKDIVKYNKQEIYPSEIENIISELPDVVDVCVCGIPDSEAGQILAAAVIKAEKSNLTTQMVYDYVTQKVDDYKNLRGGVYFTSFLEKTILGKNARFRTVTFCEGLRKLELKQRN